MAESPVPTVLAMLLCDQVIVDEQTKKKSLIGVFADVNAIQFPTTLNCAVYAKLADAEGRYKFKIRIVNLKEDTLVTEISGLEANVLDRLQPAELAMNLLGFPIVEPGKYEFQLYANDVYLSRITMQAKQINIGGPPPWQQP